MTNLGKTLKRTIGMAAVSFSCFSCITVNNNLGSDFLETDQLFDIYTTTLPLEKIEMRMADSLSGYTQRRITVGAVRDPELGLTKKACALTLVPFSDSLDFGTNPRDPHFYITMARDTFSCYGENGESLLQNIRVYELTKNISGISDVNAYDIIKNGYISKNTITKGTPVYSCLQEGLTFSFTDAYTQSLLDRLVALDMKAEEKDTLQRYLDAIPGIFIETDDPVGYGGRIDMFSLQMDYNTSEYYLENNFGSLSFTSDYGTRKNVDTSFIFYFGPDQFYNLDSLLYYTSGDFPQYCLNVSRQETRERSGLAEDKITVEGGGGLKAVVSAEELRNILMKEISTHGGNSKAILNKVSIVLPFKFPENYKDMEYYPAMLSPTCKIKYNDSTVVFAGITDASATNENQGDIDRSNLVYRPDITYHAQTLLNLSDTSDFSQYDVWMMIMAAEVENSSSSVYEEEQNSYYENLMYANYYNSMYYGNGYSGYGSYGSSSYGYNNYYNYLMMASMYGSSSTTSVTYETEVDRDRFYNAFLYGPKASDETLRPRIEITYSIPKLAR